MPKIKTEANLTNRISATIIDFILFYAFIFAYTYALGEPNNEGGYSVTGFATWGVPAMWFLFFPVAESMGGQTLGHKIMGIKVVATNGKPIGFGQAFKRRLADIIDLHFCFGLIAYLVIRNSPTHQRLGDLWAGTIVVGGASATCHNCHEKLTISAKEQIAGKYECPECGTPNFVQQNSEVRNSFSANRQMNKVLSNLPEVYHQRQEIIIAENYMELGESFLALDSIIEMTSKTGHLFSQNFWLDLKEIAQSLNQPKVAQDCHEQMLNTTREFKGVLEEGRTVKIAEDGTHTFYEV
ncbi:MAG: hypothetical protein Roseis2KO_35180 [Roseivirga sp.]